MNTEMQSIWRDIVDLLDGLTLRHAGKICWTTVALCAFICFLVIF